MESSSSSSSPEVSAATTNAHGPFSYENATFDEVMEDLCSRFILNLPDDEVAQITRVFWQVEQAHWFYDDFIRPQNPKCPSLALKKFSITLFRSCALLHQWEKIHEDAFEDWQKYRKKVPVCGAIMLNEQMDKCVLVKGWKASSGWGFPKGKINQDEPEHLCAAREVLEETGYDITSLLTPEDVVHYARGDQYVSLFIVNGVPENFNFETHTRKEISKIAWFKLSELPYGKSKQTAGKFYMVAPFINAIRIHIKEKRQRSRKVNGNAGLKAPKKTQIKQKVPMHQPGPGSASQSSDYDDPVTPSPQYSEAVSHKVEAPVDSHLAKLLSSLEMSAGLPDVFETNSKRPASALNVAAQEVRDTPMPSKATLPAIVPPPSNDHSLGMVVNGSSPKQLGPGYAYVGETNGIASPRQPNSASSYSVSPRLAHMSPVSPRRQMSRRSSSTADISPYLQKPAELPTTARRMKHLALLESVADESARMSPMIRDAPALPSAPPPSNLGYPYPPASLPPQALQDPNDLRVLYSSSVAPGHLVPSYGPPSMAPGYPPGPIQDPFLVRPRTSFNYHRPMYAAAGMPSGGISMSQAEMLNLINAQPRANPAMAPSYPYQEPPPQPYPAAGYSGPVPQPHLQGAYPGPPMQLHAAAGYPGGQPQPHPAYQPQIPAPQPQYSVAIPPYSSYTPAPPRISPMVSRAVPQPRPQSTFGAGAPKTAAQLLDILNMEHA